MRKLLAALLLFPALVLAQLGNYPALIGQKGTTPPTNCTIGQLFFDTDATAGSNIYGCTAANIWVAQGASSAPAFPGAITGGVSGGIPYFDSTTSWAASSLLGTAGVITGGGAGAAPRTTSGFTFGATTGEGLLVPAGTATTNVPALSVTRTNNNAAVVTGVKFTFTDTTSAAGFLPFQVLGGASGTTNLLSLGKAGEFIASSDTGSSVGSVGFVGTEQMYLFNSNANAVARSYTNSRIALDSNQLGLSLGSGMGVTWLATTSHSSFTKDTGLTRIGAGVLGVGTGTAASVAGTLAATNYRIASTPVILGTAPTLASGGCTSAAMVNNNGTAYFTAGVGTSCSGSQPLVFTLPAATTGWNCYARNATNPASSIPRQSSAVSTTSVTITNYAATTGLAAAWTDADVVVVSCLGG